MGTTASTPSPPEKPTPVTVEEDNYEWPENMYLETRDMAAISFLVYSFGYAVDVARKVGLLGLEETKEGRVNKTFDLPRSFSPTEVLKILQDNHEELAKHYPAAFGKEDGPATKLEYYRIIENLKAMQERAAQASTVERPLTVEEYDDRHQKHELVYGITKDDINKRITIVFRGTDNELAMSSDWMANLSTIKKQAHIPALVQDAVPTIETGFYTTGGMWLHSGFYNYVFNYTKDEDDPATWKKYDEILQDLKHILESHPKYLKEYKIYVTGHSLGAALATIVAFYLSCDDTGAIPKPVTCINFASPRVGDGNFLKAVNAAEEKGLLRMLRIVNDNDSIAFAPMTNYSHVGFQVRLYKEENVAPILTYHTSKTESWDAYWSRLWNNSLPASFNLSYDHGDYRQRVDKDKKFFENLKLKDLYKDKSLTGF